ncbi:MAG: hypothetical protein H7174_11710 [Flavobacterium sp.]|nr:hypothetical protein [Flavobacterium sp.]
MIKDFFTNTSAMTFYIISISSFFIANFVRDKIFAIYFALLIIGLICFILGLVKRFSQK